MEGFTVLKRPQQIPIILIKQIGLSLVMAATKSVAMTPLMPADTNQIVQAHQALNSPALMNVDSGRRVFPVFFCGEEVPVGQPGVSRRWLNTLRTFGADEECLYTVRKRSAVFFPIIDPILASYGIPRDFRYLPLAESELVNDCVSPKGASGYWQLMPGTARQLGLKVNGSVDERYNLRKATVAVCRHLLDLYRELGSWTLVAAAYNAGIGHIQATMSKQQSRNYYRLRLHRETSQYLFRVLAYKELLSNPTQYRLLLSERTINYLTRPLPRWLAAISLDKQSRDEAVAAEKQQSDQRANKSWGPRVNTSFWGEPSELEQWLAGAFGSNTESDLSTSNSSIPVKTLLGLVVLRFRRPRHLRYKAGNNYRPVHQWEWV